MGDREQVELVLTLQYKKNIIEFIKHADHHDWLYHNGQITDIRYPRHLSSLKYTKHAEIYEGLVYGCSNYNKQKIQNFFAQIIPEYFL